VAGNQQTGGHELDHYRHFDALPGAFRRLLRNASANYQCWWVGQLIRRHGEQRAFEYAKVQLAEFRRAIVLKHYGPTHPQADA